MPGDVLAHPCAAAASSTQTHRHTSPPPWLGGSTPLYRWRQTCDHSGAASECACATHPRRAAPHLHSRSLSLSPEIACPCPGTLADQCQAARITAHHSSYPARATTAAFALPAVMQELPHCARGSTPCPLSRPHQSRGPRRRLLSLRGDLDTATQHACVQVELGSHADGAPVTPPLSQPPATAAAAAAYAAAAVGSDAGAATAAPAAPPPVVSAAMAQGPHLPFGGSLPAPPMLVGAGPPSATYTESHVDGVSVAPTERHLLP